MNILIPHSWLKEHLETDIEPKALAESLSLSGPSVEHIYDRQGEHVYDIEVTTNRVDSMSVRGIARESAVILNQFDHQAKLKPLQVPEIPQPSGEKLPLPTIKNNPEYCKRVMSIVLADIKHNPTPEWMAKRLQQIDQQVHNSVIDITNYITHELGHPCHAFDYDKIMELGGEIIVTEAKPGKKFLTLDGEEYTTVGGEVVFENPDGEIIDLPAIKGTANSSISDQTKNVLLWIESLDAQKVRFASMTHAIRTVAAQLNEKKVDAHLADEVMKLGVSLYQELCDARIASELYDDFPGDKPQQPVVVKLETIDTYLGIEIEVNDIISILEKLECQVEVSAEQGNRQAILTIQPPTFRSDLIIPADIVEEIARIYGYHNLPSVLMETAIPLEKQSGVNFTIENRIKHFLSAIGWQEVYTYSMVSQEIASQSGLDLDQHLKLQNPLTDDRIYLRRSLLPSLEEVLDQNPHHPELSVFEIANTYTPREKNIPAESLYLSLVSGKSYSQVKGYVETFLNQFFVSKYDFVPQDKIAPLYAQAAEIVADEQVIGTIGVLQSGRIGVAIEISQLLLVAKTHPTYQPIPKYPAWLEDITFTLPEKTLVGDVIKTIQAVSELIYQVSLKDTYQRNYTFQVAYLDPTKSLSSEDIKPLREKLVKKLQADYKSELVGSI